MGAVGEELGAVVLHGGGGAPTGHAKGEGLCAGHEHGMPASFLLPR